MQSLRSTFPRPAEPTDCQPTGHADDEGEEGCEDALGQQHIDHCGKHDASENAAQGEGQNVGPFGVRLDTKRSRTRSCAAVRVPLPKMMGPREPLSNPAPR